MSYENGNDTLVCCKCNRHESVDRVVEIDGKVYCKSCLAEFSHEPRRVHAEPVRYARREERPFINKVILFLLSFTIPGVNYMYMGLVKKGLSFIIAFFGIALVCGTFDFWQIGFAIPILYIYTFFDGFTKRRQLLNGETVPDDASELKNFFRDYKKPLIVIVGLLFIFDSFGGFYYRMMSHGYGMMGPLFGWVGLILGILIVAYGLKVIFGRKDGRDKKDVIDIRKNEQEEEYR